MFSPVVATMHLAGWRRGLAAGLAALAVFGTVTGCSHQVNADADAVLHSPVATFTLDVTKDGLILLGDAMPGLEPLTDIGVWGIDELQGNVAKAHDQDPDATLLIITHTVDGRREGTIYRIDTDRTLQVTMNGRFIEEITPGVITITARPGTDSKIVVSDANADEKVYREGTVVFSRRGYSANLDTGVTSSINMPGAEILQGFATTVTAINGTTILLWPGPGQPSLNSCESFPADQWSTRLSGLRLGEIPDGTTWCVHTAKGHYGVIVAQANLVNFTFSYVLWDSSS